MCARFKIMSTSPDHIADELSLNWKSKTVSSPSFFFFEFLALFGIIFTHFLFPSEAGFVKTMLKSRPIFFLTCQDLQGIPHAIPSPSMSCLRHVAYVTPPYVTPGQINRLVKALKRRKIWQFFHRFCLLKLFGNLVEMHLKSPISRIKSKTKRMKTSRAVSMTGKKAKMAATQTHKTTMDDECRYSASSLYESKRCIWQW